MRHGRWCGGAAVVLFPAVALAVDIRPPVYVHPDVRALAEDLRAPVCPVPIARELRWVYLETFPDGARRLQTAEERERLRAKRDLALPEGIDASSVLAPHAEELRSRSPMLGRCATGTDPDCAQVAVDLAALHSAAEIDQHIYREGQEELSATTLAHLSRVQFQSFDPDTVDWDPTLELKVLEASHAFERASAATDLLMSVATAAIAIAIEGEKMKTRNVWSSIGWVAQKTGAVDPELERAGTLTIYLHNRMPVDTTFHASGEVLAVFLPPEGQALTASRRAEVTTPAHPISGFVHTLRVGPGGETLVQLLGADAIHELCVAELARRDQLERLTEPAETLEPLPELPAAKKRLKKAAAFGEVMP